MEAREPAVPGCVDFFVLWAEFAQAELLYAIGADFASIISEKIEKYSTVFLLKMWTAGCCPHFF